MTRAHLCLRKYKTYFPSVYNTNPKNKLFTVSFPNELRIEPD